MSTLSADSRLRNRVAAVNGTVILVGAGNVDRVIRFTKLPACLVPFKTKTEGASVFPVMLNLDRGPDQEAWNAAQREAFLGARRDRPMPEALPVAADNAKGWSVDEEDVPVVEFEAPTAAEEEKKFVCETCTVGFNTENALGIHKTRAKHT
jgi:hypothetical protein